MPIHPKPAAVAPVDAVDTAAEAGGRGDAAVLVEAVVGVLAVAVGMEAAAVDAAAAAADMVVDADSNLKFQIKAKREIIWDLPIFLSHSQYRFKDGVGRTERVQ